MKTSGQSPQIIHTTVETGDRQAFDLTDANYDPAALAMVLDLAQTEIAGFRLVWSCDHDIEIKVLYRGRLLTINRATWSCQDILLITRIMAAVPAEVMMMAADLEQCAAIALL